jgi:hypothetical protein
VGAQTSACWLFGNVKKQAKHPKAGVLIGAKDLCDEYSPVKKNSSLERAGQKLLSLSFDR